MCLNPAAILSERLKHRLWAA